MEPPNDSPNIFKKSNIDCCMEKPSGTFFSVKYNAFSNFCFAEFLAYYTKYYALQLNMMSQISQKQKQTKALQLSTLCPKYYHMMKLQKL